MASIEIQWKCQVIVKNTEERRGKLFIELPTSSEMRTRQFHPKEKTFKRIVAALVIVKEVVETLLLFSPHNLPLLHFGICIAIIMSSHSC